MASGAITGERPGTPFPTFTCHTIRGATVALISGSGPIFFESLPHSHPNDGTGIVGIQDGIDEQPAVHSKVISASAAIGGATGLAFARDAD
jgi:hypothetical protein